MTPKINPSATTLIADPTSIKVVMSSTTTGEPADTLVPTTPTILVTTTIATTCIRTRTTSTSINMVIRNTNTSISIIHTCEVKTKQARRRAVTEFVVTTMMITTLIMKMAQFLTTKTIASVLIVMKVSISVTITKKLSRERKSVGVNMATKRLVRCSALGPRFRDDS